MYTLFTDPHIGTRRAAHTTRDSAKKLTEALYQTALAAADSGPNPICLGDLFDRAFNDEATLVQGFNVASKCLFTLAGNHDETNREGTVTSLRALKDMGVNIVASENLNTPYYWPGPDGIYVVPHHASQALFEKALFDAAEHAAHHRVGKPAYLFLHCNYDAPFAEADDTLNLAPEVAGRLLEPFDLILLGHEHKAASHFEGRVFILGNTHPTSFSDITDKYVWNLDTQDDGYELTKQLIWSKDVGYRELTMGQVLPDLTGVQFIDVIGAQAAADAVAVAEYIQAVWKAGTELLAVRNNVQLNSGLADIAEAERPTLVDLKTRIAQDLEGSDLLDLYNELVKDVSA